MNTYQGAASIMRSDGTELLVTASLRSQSDGMRTGWDGTLTASPDTARALANTTEGRLRLGDGREGAFLRPDTSDWVGTSQLRILGQDEPPF